jgi:hypothetical protein
MRAWPILFALPSVLACGGSTRPLSTPAGTYVLSAVNQHRVPAAQTAGDSILSGGLVVHSNGAYAFGWFAPTYYFGTRDVIALTDSGSWSQLGAQLQFASMTGVSLGGTYDATSLSIQFASDTWQFTRR